MQMRARNVENKAIGLYLIENHSVEAGVFKLGYIVKNLEAEKYLEEAFTVKFGFFAEEGNSPYFVSFLVNERNTYVRQLLPKIKIGEAVKAMLCQMEENETKANNKLTEWVYAIHSDDGALVLRDSRHDGILTFEVSGGMTGKTVLSELKHAVKYGDMTLRLKGKNRVVVNDGYDFTGNIQLKNVLLLNPMLENCTLDNVHAPAVAAEFKMCEVSNWVVPNVCGELSLSYGLYTGKDILHASRIVRIMDRKVG